MCPADKGGWARLEADGLTLLVPGSEERQSRFLLKIMVALRGEVAERLGGVPHPDLAVYIAQSDQDFKTLTRNRIPHWGIGVAYPQAMTIVLRYRAGQTEALLQTARHEFSHILLHNAVPSTSDRLPVWFNEGVAMWVAREWRLRQSLEVAVAAFCDGLVRLAEVDSVLTFGAARAELAYDQSYLAVLFIIERGGEGALQDVINHLRDGTSFDAALHRVTGLTPEAFEIAFGAFVAARFGFLALLTSGEAIWFYIVFLVLMVWVGVRLRNRRTLARWEAEDPLDALPLRLRAKIKRERK